MQSTPRILVVDGTNVLYRAHHALGRSGLSHAGRPVWAVHGALMSVVKAAQAVRATHVSVALDTPGGCPARLALWPAYKATRSAPVPELASQLGWAPSALTQLGLPTTSAPGWEADDLLASMAAQARRRGWSVVLLTSDRDAYQLLGDRVEVRTPDDRTVTAESLQADMGLTPAQYAELAALRGEPSDNLPGVAGIGAVTGVKLLQRFGNLESVFAADDQSLREVLGAKTIANLRRDEHLARTSAQVARLRADLPVDEPVELAALDADRCRRVGEQIGLPQASAKLAGIIETAAMGVAASR